MQFKTLGHARRWSRLLTAAAVAVLASAALAATALAHETRTVANGKYTFVTGWQTEPAYVGERNAVSLTVTRAGTSPAQPVEGLDRTLKVQVRQGAETREFPLTAVPRQPGAYAADLVPTRAAEYQLTFVGTIGDDAINEKFDTADGKFHGVQAIAPLEFPLAGSETVQTTAAIQEVRGEAQSARTLALVGIGVGVLGLLAALVMGLRLSRRTAR